MYFNCTNCPFYKEAANIKKKRIECGIYCPEKIIGTETRTDKGHRYLISEARGIKDVYRLY
jgi:hypothetical protein